MKLVTISKVSNEFDVSTRMLRYYEKIGLLSSTKKDDYAYRVYDEKAIKRIQQIIILRKLDLSLKNIERILQNTDVVDSIAIFQEKIAEIKDEVDSLNTIRSILEMLINKLNQTFAFDIDIEFFDDVDIAKIKNSTSLIKKRLKERNSMEDLNQASSNLSEIKSVRILYLPPATIESSHFVGDESEQVAGDNMKNFIMSSNLCEIKPDFRLYGFNSPNPDENGNHGYEFWVTIQDDLNVKDPLIKKHFQGGLYAAHCIKMGDFHEWQDLSRWIEQSKDYDYDRREPLGMNGTLEEHLNAYSYYKDDDKNKEFMQLDLLTPIK